MAIPEEIFCDNDLPLEIGPVAVRSFLTGITTLGTGRTVQAMISATEGVGAVAIHVGLSIILTEGAGSTAMYYGGWDGSALTAQLLPTYKDTLVYVICWSDQDFRVVFPVTVRAVKPAEAA